MFIPSTTIAADGTVTAPPPTPPGASAAAIRANVVNNLATLQTWLVNNPNGAVLTAGQTKTLANILIGISKLLLDDTTAASGT